MIKRLPVIIVGIPFVAGLILWHPISLLVLMACVSVLGQREVFSLLAPDLKIVPLLEYVAGVLLLSATLLFQEQGLLFGFSAAVVGMMCFSVLRGLQGANMRRFSVGLFSVVYLPFCLGFFLLIARSCGPQTVLALLFLVWALDIGAYIVGMTLRGARLAPHISPNKTIAGACGGTGACLLGVWAQARAGFLVSSSTRLVLLGIAIAVIGQIADLFESVLKREAGQKDSGAMFGAHGGLLDRVDSVLFLGPVAYFLLCL